MEEKNTIILFSSCWRLNHNGTWIAGKDMLEPRRHFSLSMVEDEIFAIGGSTTSYSVLRSVEKYSLSNDEGWLKMTDAPIGIHKHCTVMLNTSYLMIIGGNQNNQVNLNQHQICAIPNIYK